MTKKFSIQVPINFEVRITEKQFIIDMITTDIYGKTNRKIFCSIYRNNQSDSYTLNNSFGDRNYCSNNLEYLFKVAEKILASPLPEEAKTLFVSKLVLNKLSE